MIAIKIVFAVLCAALAILNLLAGISVIAKNKVRSNEMTDDEKTETKEMLIYMSVSVTVHLVTAMLLFL